MRVSYTLRPHGRLVFAGLPLLGPALSLTTGPGRFTWPLLGPQQVWWDMANPYSPGQYWDYTMFFESDRGDGWSESYRFKQVDVPDWDVPANSMVGLRLPILCDVHQLVYMRLSDPGKSRDIYPLAVLSTLPAVGQYSTSTTVMPADGGIKVKCYCDLATYMVRCFHGIANDGLLTDESFPSGGVILGPTQDFYDDLIAKKWMITNPYATPHLPAFADRYVNSVSFGRVMNHKLGRPFGLRPGRSSPA